MERERTSLFQNNSLTNTLQRSVNLERRLINLKEQEEGKQKSRSDVPVNSSFFVQSSFNLSITISHSTNDNIFICKQLICNYTDTTVALYRCNLYSVDDLTSHIYLKTTGKCNDIACTLTSDVELIQL